LEPVTRLTFVAVAGRDETIVIVLGILTAETDRTSIGERASERNRAKRG